MKRRKIVARIRESALSIRGRHVVVWSMGACQLVNKSKIVSDLENMILALILWNNPDDSCVEFARFSR